MASSVKAQVKAIVAGILDIADPESIGDEDLLSNHGADSANCLDIKLAIERHFQRRVPADWTRDDGPWLTINEIVAVLEPAAASASAP